MTAATKKKPFAFEVGYELFDAGGERLREVLLIENPGSGQALQLSIVNALVQEQETITLHHINEVNSSRYHFRLRFPANTLAPREASAVGADWAVLRAGNSDGTTDVFLAWRSPDVTLAPGESLTAALHGVSALPTVGAQVVMELKWPSPDTDPLATAALTIVTPTGPGQPGDYELEAQRPLGVRNRRGRQDCPLRVGFVGANQVLNVGNEQGTLRLRLSNDAPQGSANGTLRFVYDANEPTRTSRLVVALPVGTVADAPWALGTEQQVKDITFSTLPDWSRSAATLSADRAFVEWTFTPTKEVTLAPRQFLELQLGKLVTLHPSGPTQLVVRYGAVPGYWDGERVCTLEKAPLVFGQKVDASHDYSSHVGIGKATPTARLYLRGGPLRLHDAEIQNEGQLVFRSDADKSGDATSVHFFKKDETTPLLALRSDGGLVLGGGTGLPGKMILNNADGTVSLWAETRTSAMSTVESSEDSPSGEEAPSEQIEPQAIEPTAGKHIGLRISTQNNGTAVEFSLVTPAGRVKDKTGWLVPVGTILAYGGPNVPEGWLRCDGSTKSKATYAELFAAIEDTYKGSSSLPSGQFRLPSLMARVALGAYVTDQHNYPLGTIGGQFTHTLTIDEMPVHDHFVDDPGHSHAVTGTDAPNNPRDRLVADTCYSANSRLNEVGSAHVKTLVTLRTNGGGKAHNNMQPYTTVNYIIKY